MAKVKKGEHGLILTEGQFKLKGLVTALQKNDALKQTTQRNGFERNTLKFGIKTSEDSEIYVQIADSEKEDAHFYKKATEKGGEGVVKKISWAQRNNFKDEGFEPIGVSIGLDKDEKNKNIITNMFDYDAAAYLHKKLKDDMPVLVVGELEISSFQGEDGLIRDKKLKIKKIYNSLVDFSKEDFNEENFFKQKCLFMDISQATKNGKPDTEDPHWIVKAKIVTYKSLEDIEFVIRNKTLAQNFKKHLKPYNRISIHGKINNKRLAQQVTETSSDDWGGESDPFQMVNNPRKFEFEIKGIETKDIDTKTYTEEIVKNAFKAKNEFGGDNAPWEDSGEVNNNDDDEFEW